MFLVMSGKLTEAVNVCCIFITSVFLLSRYALMGGEGGVR